MPYATRIGDSSSHGGVVTGPGIPHVLIGGLPAAVVGDIHSCVPPATGHPPTPFTVGSSTVMIGGRPAIRMGDSAACGATPVVGEFTVMIG